MFSFNIECYHFKIKTEFISGSISIIILLHLFFIYNMYNSYFKCFNSTL